jgi:Flp pilus assembly protein TadG
MTEGQDFRLGDLTHHDGCVDPVSEKPISPRDNNRATPSRPRHNKQTLRSWRGGLLGRLMRSRAGATMVEFALVGPLFLLLTFAVVDNGLVLFTQTVLDNATREAARMIRVGKVQMSGDTTGTGIFQTTLCNNLGGFVACPSGNLKYHVQSSNVGFSSLDATVTTNSSGVMTSTGFSPGTGQNYVLVQVAYAQPYIMAFLDRIAGAKANITLLSTVAFQTEHYQ